MNEFLPFIVIGLATGAVYGLAGMGLVLTYKTSGIFNFGYGSVAALAVFVFYFLHTEHGVPWPAAAVICLGVFAPLVGLVLELLARSLERASETIKVVATVGLILIVESLASLWYRGEPADVPALPPPVHGADPRRQRHLGADHPLRVLGGGVGGPVLVLPVGAPRRRHARRGRQPRAGVDERRRSGRGSGAGPGSSARCSPRWPA